MLRCLCLTTLLISVAGDGGATPTTTAAAAGTTSTAGSTVSGNAVKVRGAGTETWLGEGWVAKSKGKELGFLVSKH